MENGSSIFQQARHLVQEADRKLEELEHRFNEAFEFSREERDELMPRASDEYASWTIELAPKSLRAIFLLTPKTGREWSLEVMDPEHGMRSLGLFRGGDNGVGGSRRLRAARVVSAIGSWVEKAQMTTAGPQQTVVSSRKESRMNSEAKPIEVKADLPPREQMPMPAAPRWLDMLPDAQGVPLPDAAASKKNPQVGFGLGRIFGGREGMAEQA
ncbi:MAG: hypothetical protein JWM54_1319 [Acidobacteriaceae bacterium]|jgi:hypothetical protein|nr:hypothetical protein [Acidobacteriaceae bacterium]